MGVAHSRIDASLSFGRVTAAVGVGGGVVTTVELAEIGGGGEGGGGGLTKGPVVLTSFPWTNRDAVALGLESSGRGGESPLNPGLPCPGCCRGSGC